MNEIDSNGDDLNFYRFAINSLPIAVATVNSEFKITRFNSWAEELTGYSAKEAIGRYCGDILQGGMCKINCPLRAVIKKRQTVVRLETTITNRSQKTIPVRMNTAGLFDDEGRLLGGLEAFQDISHLKALEREKANLISMFAHDIKSSLTIIGGFVLRLLKKRSSLDEEKQLEYLDIMKNETGKLSFLVNDFLEFSRLQTGRLKLEFSAISLDKELMELLDAYQVKAKQAGINLELENEEELPIIEADANRLRRVFTNLLDNALKFSKNEGVITISTHETDKQVVVNVKDEGVGIDSKDLPYIFESFNRGRGAEKKEGFGLGLATVKAIVEAHGGRVLVKSELGKGSVFKVILPKERPAQEPAEQLGEKTRIMPENRSA
ncbi:MAG: PAS domain-containing sensor histidine kinase [Desulfatiglandaceae bacterium]